jgi:hypothetical protein
MELHSAIFRCFCLLLKDLTAGGVNRNLAVVPTNIPVSVETIRDNTSIQIVLLQIQATLVHTTLVVWTCN